MKNVGDKAIRYLAKMNNKKNKSRSILVFLVIVLSSVLLTAIMSYGVGIVKYDKLSAEYQYGRYTGMLSGLSKEDINKLKDDDNFTELGLIHDCGIVKSDATISLSYFDEKARELSSTEDKIDMGNYPKKADEILVSEGMIKSCGIENVKLNDKITLYVRLDTSLAYEPMEFIVCGFLKEDEAGKTTYNAYVAEEFYKEHILSHYRDFSVIFNVSDDMNLDYDNAEDVMKNYVVSMGFDEKQLSINTMYILLVLDPGKEIVITCIVLILMVVFFSMIVIYNIFQISLVQRMQEYGRIKALGASKKQIKKLINWEGIMIALPAIPLGTFLGYLVFSCSFRLVLRSVNNLQSVNINHINMFSPVVFFGSMMIAFATVWLAMVKPKRKLARISAIEAMDFRESTDIRKKKSGRRSANGIRKGRESVNEISLALANLAANKKQAISTMLTMGLSCVLLVVVMNCIGNIDIEYEARKGVTHGQFEISLDYTFYDTVYPEDNLDVILSDNPLNQEFVEKLKNISGVTNVTSRDYLVIESGDGEKDVVNVISREDLIFERDKGAAKGVIDYDQASKENQIFFGWSNFMSEYGVEMGQPMEYSLWNGHERKKFNSEVTGSFGALTGGWAITEDTYQNFGYKKGSNIGMIWVDCKEADRAGVETEIRELMSNYKHLELESYEYNYKQQEFGTRLIRWSLYSLLIIISFIGFMNMVNTMIISITTRKREYGIMQAVGMTGRQLNRSLTLQGLIYIGGTLFISLIIGIPLGYMTFVKCKSISGFGMNVYHFPIMEIVIMTVVMLMMQLMLSLSLSKNVKKDSLIERIRY